MVLVAYLKCSCMVVREMGYPRGHEGVHFDRDGACVRCMLAFRHGQAMCAGVSVFHVLCTLPAPRCQRPHAVLMSRTSCGPVACNTR